MKVAILKIALCDLGRHPGVLPILRMGWTSDISCRNRVDCRNVPYGNGWQRSLGRSGCRQFTRCLGPVLCEQALNQSIRYGLQRGTATT